MPRATRAARGTSASRCAGRARRRLDRLAVAPGLPFLQRRVSLVELRGDQAGREAVVLAQRVLEGGAHAGVVVPLLQPLADVLAGPDEALAASVARLPAAGAARARLRHPDLERAVAVLRTQRGGDVVGGIRAADVAMLAVGDRAADDVARQAADELLDVG